MPLEDFLGLLMFLLVLYSKGLQLLSGLPNPVFPTNSYFSCAILQKARVFTVTHMLHYSRNAVDET